MDFGDFERPSKAVYLSSKVQRSPGRHKEVFYLVFVRQHILHHFDTHVKPWRDPTISNAYDISFPIYTHPHTMSYLGLDFCQAATTLPLSTSIVLSSCFSVSPNSTLFHVTIRASFMSNSNTLIRLWYPP